MIEILVVRDPDSADDITVWRDGVEVTAECKIAVVDAGAGWSYDDWLESAMWAAMDTTPAARAAIEAAYADPPGKQYVEDWPDEDEED